MEATRKITPEQEEELMRIRSMESVKTLDDLAERDEAILLDLHVICPPNLKTVDPISAISSQPSPNQPSKSMVMARLNDEVVYTKKLLSWLRKYQERISPETWKIGTTPEMLIAYTNDAVGDLQKRLRNLRKVNSQEKDQLRELLKLHRQLSSGLEESKYREEMPDGIEEFLSSPELRVPSDSDSTEMSKIYRLRPSAISMISRGLTMAEDTSIVTLDKSVFDLAMNLLTLYEGKTLPWAPDFKLDEDTKLLIDSTSVGLFYLNPQKKDDNYSLDSTFVWGF
jgi:hypothetical protein